MARIGINTIQKNVRKKKKKNKKKRRIHEDYMTNDKPEDEKENESDINLTPE